LYGTASSKADQFTDISFLTRKGLVKDKFLLFISVLEKRKNIERLMDAFMAAYPKLQIPLVIVGGKGYGYKDIVKHHKDLPEEIRKNVILAGYVSETDKYALLNNARAFVWPTLYEGIGLPVVEAFASNLPVLTSRRGALEEAGGDAALYIENPYDVEEIRDGIIRIAEDEKLRKTLQTHMPDQVAKFTPEKFNSRFKQAIDGLK
jgi:glycosyltransferase involved in cell wall biosynthesis